MSMRIPERWVRTWPGSRFVCTSVPLPPGIAGGGAIELEDGTVINIEFVMNAMGGDKRRYKRELRRAMRKPTPGSGLPVR